MGWGGGWFSSGAEGTDPATRKKQGRERERRDLAYKTSKEEPERNNTERCSTVRWVEARRLFSASTFEEKYLVLGCGPQHKEPPPPMLLPSHLETQVELQSD